MEAEITKPNTTLEDLTAWILNNTKVVVGGVVLLGAVVVGVGAFSWYKQQNNEKANEQIFAPPQLGTTKAVGSADSYLKVAQENASSDVGERAELLAASVMFAQGKFADAQTQFEKFSRSHESSALLSQAFLGAASSLDAQGKTAEAVTKYQDVIKRFGTESAATQAKLSLARIYESQNNLAEAMRFYEQLDKSPNPYDPWRAVAMGRREALLTQHPELAKPEPQEQVIEMTTPPAPGQTPAAPATAPKTEAPKP